MTPQAHVAVVAFPFSSHAGSLFSLARAMASLAPSSHFSFVSTKHSLSSIKSQQLLPNISLVAISDGITPPHIPKTSFEPIELFLESFKDNLRESLKIAEQMQGHKVRCLVSDLFVWLTADVADELGVKWVPVRTGSPHDFYARMNVDLIRDVVGFGEEANEANGDKLLSFLPGLSNHRVMDLSYGICVGDPNFVYHKICYQMAHRVLDSDVLVINGIEGFDSTLDAYFKDKFDDYFPVGPFHLLNASLTVPPTDSYGCLSWLDFHEPASVAYVSLGTIAFLHPSELISLANGLEESGVPFLWSLKEEMQSLLPSGFLDRMNDTKKGKIIPWAPQTSVLKHSALGVFVTHSGWNSVLESIVGGVPLICRPFFGDQNANTRSISHDWKIGVALDEGCFTEKSVVKALDVVLKTNEGKKIRDKMHEFKELVTRAAGENGSSRNNLKSLVELVCG